MRCPFCFAEKEADAPVCPTCNRDTEIPPSLRKEHDDLVRMRDQLLAELAEGSQAALATAATGENVRHGRRLEMVARIPAARSYSDGQSAASSGRRLMECPFCTLKRSRTRRPSASIARDLRVVRPIILEIQDLVTELDGLQRRLGSVNWTGVADAPCRSSRNTRRCTSYQWCCCC